MADRALQPENPERTKKPEFLRQPLQITNLSNRYYPHDRTSALPFTESLKVGDV
jgi:hypothetical protein